MKRENEFSCLFGQYYFLWPDITIKNNIVAKKATELVLLFHKNKNKLVFLWPNMSQKSIRELQTEFCDKISLNRQLAQLNIE